MVANGGIARIDDRTILIIADTGNKPVLFVALVALALNVTVFTAGNVCVAGLAVTIVIWQIVVVSVVATLAVRALFGLGTLCAHWHSVVAGHTEFSSIIANVRIAD